MGNDTGVGEESWEGLGGKNKSAREKEGLISTNFLNVIIC